MRLCGRGVVTEIQRGKKGWCGDERSDLLELLEQLRNLWHHPLFLPSVMLRIYSSRAKASRHALGVEFRDLEDAIQIATHGKIPQSCGCESMYENIAYLLC